MPKIINVTTLHEGFTRLLKLRLRLEDGTELDREVEDHGRAVAVLPYDPVRRTVLLVRLLRAPVLLTVHEPNLLEAPAGMVDEEDPEETARRELREEVGLQVRDLSPVGCVWTSPGVSTERMNLFLARYTEADRLSAGGGLQSEHENIRVVEFPIDELWSKVQTEEIADMKLLTLTLALHARQPKLFAPASHSQ